LPDKCSCGSDLRVIGTKPDIDGTPVLLPQSEIAKLRRDMGPDFLPQMMNDPAPQTERPWDRNRCEHFIERSEAVGHGTLFVLSDPAPAKVGSWKGVGEKSRADGTKDDWATCVVKVRNRGQLQEIILLDGQFSQQWAPDAGMDVICEFLGRFPGAWVYIEAYGGLGKDYERDLWAATRRNAVRMKWLPFEGSYAANAKNNRFAKLSEKAKQGEFQICKSCPTDFVDKFLGQARNWMPLPGGRNTNRFDDCADVVSMAATSAVLQQAPQAELIEQDAWEEEDAFQGQRRTRYCAV
jgi:hypothetical protein